MIVSICRNLADINYDLNSFGDINCTYFYFLPSPFSLLPSPFSLLPSPFSIIPSPFSIIHSPCSLFPAPCSLLPDPFSHLPSPCSLLPAPRFLLFMIPECLHDHLWYQLSLVIFLIASSLPTDVIVKVTMMIHDGLADPWWSCWSLWSSCSLIVYPCDHLDHLDP